MPRRPSLSSLRLFMLVAQHSSFSAAGRLANVSQPALSRSIRLLEEDLGVRLFDRNSRNVALTSAGEALLPIVERLASDFDHAFSALAQTFAGERGRVVIGALPSFAAVQLPPAIASFQALYPQVEIQLRDHLSGPLLQQLRDRQIDLALTTQPDGDGYAFTPLHPDPYMLVVRRDSPLNVDGPAPWSIFGDHPFIAMAASSSVRQMTDQVMHRADVKVRPLYECTQLATVGGLLVAGLGITALPQSTLGLLRAPNLVARPLVDPPVERMLGIVSFAARTLPPAAQAFVRHLLANVGGPDAAAEPGRGATAR